MTTFHNEASKLKISTHSNTITYKLVRILCTFKAKSFFFSDEQSLCKDVCGGTSTSTVSYESNEQTKEEETGSVLEVRPDEEKYQLEEDNSSTRMSLNQQDCEFMHDYEKYYITL